MKSRLYAGELRHRRTKPKAYEFSYGVYYVDLDLDEIDEVAQRIGPFSRNRFNIMSFMDRDHMGGAGGDVRAAVRARLAGRGIDPDGVRVSLLTNTRVLGYVFNPVSFYFVRGRSDDALQLVLAEVHNTHGEEHVYDLDRAGDGAVYASRADKVLYVSPFIDMDARYVFECPRGRGRRLRPAHRRVPARRAVVPGAAHRAAAATDEPQCRVDARALSVHHAQDDRADPLAGAEAVAAGREVPAAK
jgi:DUF1365 family protein